MAKRSNINIPAEHIGLFVRNLPAMSVFYRKRMGFLLNGDYVAEAAMMKKIFGISSRCRIQYLYYNRFRLELFYFLDKRLKRPVAGMAGYNHWAFVVSDKKVFCRKLKRQKVKVIEVKKPQSTTFFIQDPENNLIEIREL